MLGLKILAKEYVFNPPLETIIGNEGVLMILGSFEETQKFKKIYLN